MPRGGSIGFAPGGGRNPTLLDCTHFLSRASPPTESRPRGVGKNSRSPPLSTSVFLLSRMLGRSAAVSASSSTIALASARSASKSVRPWRSVASPSSSAGESGARAPGCCRASLRIVSRTRALSSSGPGSANSNRMPSSSNSGRAGREGPTSTSVRAECANSCAVSRSVRSVVGFSRCACGSLRIQTPSPVEIWMSLSAPARSSVFG